MSRPLFRALTLDPNKRIRLLIDQHDDNNNDLPHPHSTSSSSSNNLLVSYSSTSNLQTSQHSTVSNSRLPQRCAPQMPFVSGMEREEEEEYHLQSALDAQRRLGSAKIRAVPIPDLYEDLHSQTIYPPNVNLPKQLIRLQPLQLESDEPDYDMDKIDQDWFESVARTSLPNLTHLQYETIIDQLENASTRILISFDEARSLLPSIDELHLKSVYEFWSQRRTTRDKRLKFRLLTERDIKEEKGKQHPYVVFRRRVEKMTTRKNRKNDEQAYMSMLKLRSNFEAVVKLINMIKVRETSKASLLKCALSIFQARCECKADEDPVLLASTSNNVTLPSNNDRQTSVPHHPRSSLKTSLLMNSTNHLTNTQQQQLLMKISRFDQQKKASLSSSTLASLLQAPIQQQTRSLSNDSDDSLQPKLKRFKGSNSSSKKLLKTVNSTDKLTQLLSSPTTPSTGLVHNLPFPPTLTNTPQSLLERLSPGNIFTSQSNQQQSLPPGKRRSKNLPSGTIKQNKNPRNLSQTDLWASLSENLPAAAILLKAQLDAPKRLQQQKEDFENNTSRRVILQDGSAVLSNSNENINNSVDGDGTSVDDEESNDPWKFRPKAGCRYLRPIDQDQQQQQQQQEVRPQKRSAFAAFYYVTCSEQGHLGKRRVRLGRGGRLLYDRHVEQENKDFTSNSSDVSHIIDKPILWRLSSRPDLKDSYRLHSHLTVEDHTRSLAHHYQSKSTSDSFELNDEFYHHHHVNTSPSASSIELDHPYSCSSRHIHQALRTLSEPTPPSPSSSPSPPLPLTSSHSITPVQQMILISTPPTPPPSSSSTSNQMDIDGSPHSQMHDADASHFYTKSSSAFILSPTPSFFPSNQPTSYLLPSGSPTSTTVVASSPNASGQPSSPISSKSSCARVQFVQMHRIHHPPSAPHPFASSTPVTTSDS